MESVMSVVLLGPRVVVGVAAVKRVAFSAALIANPHRCG
jgi:hypothetical protein